MSQRLSSKPQEVESDDTVKPEAQRTLLVEEEIAQRFKFDQELTALANFQDMMWDYGGQEVFTSCITSSSPSAGSARHEQRF